ncbi:MAG: hypothetical protein Q7S48_00595 [bacterium]|nr:hypothetical protein [bacterium]
MQSRNTRRSIVVVLALLFSLFSIAFLGRISFSVPLLSILLLLFLATKRTVMIWTFVVGLSFEMVSPYPKFTYLLSLLTAVAILRICMHYYLSHRTILSGAIVGGLGNLVFVLGIQGFSRLGAFFTDGWIPAFDRAFALALAGQTIIMALAVVILLAIFWRFSPKLRGVVISRGM